MKYDYREIKDALLNAGEEYYRACELADEVYSSLIEDQWSGLT